MQRVVLLALGSRGDVEPCIALAQALRDEGHEVVVLALEDFQQLITSAGVEFVSMGASLPRPYDASAAVSWAMTHAHRHKLIAVEGVQHWLRSIAADVAGAVLREVRPSDVIISGLLTLDDALALRSAWGCPVAVALFAPCLPTRSGPSLVEAVMPTRTTVVNLWSGALTWSAGARWSRPSGSIVRRNLGLSQTSVRHIQPTMLDVPMLLATSSILVPPAADWPHRVWLTGPWAKPNTPQCTPPDDLSEFLERRPAPLFVGFGSVGRPSDTELFIDASRKSGIRIITTRPRGLEAKTGLLDQNVYVAEEIPHAWLFPRLAGVIHHGSAGTTITAMRAGVPSTAIPHQFDQHYYAWRLSLLGVGPAAIPRRRLNSNNLARLMRAATIGPAAATYRVRAQYLAERAAFEDGTAQAIRVMRSEGLV